MFFVVLEEIKKRTKKSIDELTVEELKEIRYGTPLLFMTAREKRILTDMDFGDEFLGINLDTKEVYRFKKTERESSVNEYILNELG